MKVHNILLAAALCMVSGSCTTKISSKDQIQTYTINLDFDASPDTRYKNLTHGIDIFVSSNISNSEILDASECSYVTKMMIANSRINVDPPIKDFIQSSIGLYARSSGINVGGGANNNYALRISVRNFCVVLGNQTRDRGVVEMECILSNPDNETLLQQTVRGRYVAPNAKTSYSYLLNRAFDSAVKEINWDGITGYLKVPKHAEQQPLAQVRGDGNTALENTIIRWNVLSRPAGADVYWRVVSSTPDVKNTNSAYLGTTPYESTESFDIHGLSHANSGNIQIELKCDKPGYIPQTRRFNLRQVIDQKEISTKFNLVKDE